MSGARIPAEVKNVARAARTASPEVDAYIDRAPENVRAQLRAVRSAIRAAIPDAVEVISYGMPGYSYPGYPYRGMVAWFGRQRTHIGLYLRPPTVADHRKALAGYATTKSAVHLPLGRAIPSPLVRKLVRASARLVRASGRRTMRRSSRTRAPAARRR